jgi:hypothetical protein
MRQFIRGATLGILAEVCVLSVAPTTPWLTCALIGVLAMAYEITRERE